MVMDWLDGPVNWPGDTTEILASYGNLLGQNGVK
jgi:hypothetical protein